MLKTIIKQIIIRPLFITSFAVFTSVTASASGVLETAVDAAVKPFLEESGAGAVIAVLQDGKPLIVKGYGFANIEHQVPVKRETIFQSGSVGKMFTATAIMLLQEEGKLSIQDNLRQYFPKAPKLWEKITVQQLLSHRSGLGYASFNESSPEGQTSPLALEYSDDTLVKLISEAPQAFEPGTDYRYSNEGYALLGILVKKVSGQFYGDYLREKLWQPVGMHNTQVNEINDIIPNRAQGYEAINDKLSPAAYVSHALSQTADGSLLMNIDDLIAWDNALRSSSFLPSEKLEEMYKGYPYPDGTVSNEDYGYGWRNSYVRGHRLVGHSGSWQGFRTDLKRFIGKGLTIAVLANADTISPGDISEALAGLFDPDLAPYTPLPDQDITTTTHMKALTFDYLEGKAGKENYSDTMLPFLSKVQVKRYRGDIKAERKGSGFRLVHKRTEGNHTVLVYKISTNRDDINYEVIYHVAPNGKIERMRFQ